MTSTARAGAGQQEDSRRRPVLGKPVHYHVYIGTVTIDVCRGLQSGGWSQPSMLCLYKLRPCPMSFGSADHSHYTTSFGSERRICAVSCDSVGHSR
eukprot:10075484-Heterocapsa_arctica.AAC.1